MLQHINTIEPLEESDDTWVFYEGTQVELEAVRAWLFDSSLSNYSIDAFNLVETLDLDPTYRQGFGFQHRNDALMFRMSW